MNIRKKLKHFREKRLKMKFLMQQKSNKNDFKENLVKPAVYLCTPSTGINEYLHIFCDFLILKENH